MKDSKTNKTMTNKSKQDLVNRPNAPLATPTDLKASATKDIAGAMNLILANIFALYLKTKNFHWHISPTQRVLDSDAEYVEPMDMLAELRDDNNTLALNFREVRDVCDERRDIASASLIEVWIDETKRRTWFLFESIRQNTAA